jgi:hypothetical protein
VQGLGNAVGSEDGLMLVPLEWNVMVGQEIIDSHGFALQRRLE